MIGAGIGLQVVACVTTLAAVWFTGHKHASGPALNVAAALCFAAVNAYAGLWLCALFSAAMAAMNLRNFILWSK